MVKERSLREKKKLSVKTYIALAVFIETAVNAVFSLVFHEFINVFYSDYLHLTVWGDIVAIVSVIVSFIIYDSFAHAAYHKIRSRLMFLGVVYVASKAASIVHYITAMVVNLLTVNAGDMVQNAVTAALSVFEIAVDIVAAVWLMGFFERKVLAQESEKDDEPEFAHDI